MSMKIVIRCGKEQRTFLLHGDDICQSVQDVKQFSCQRFPHLEKEQNIRIYWNDQDGDEISVVTDGDYRSFMLATEHEKRRLIVEIPEPTQEEYASVQSSVPSPPADASTDVGRPVHANVICDVCDQLIVGHRYRCLTCYDYDLCMTCESKYRHKDHIMLRIPRPPAGHRRHAHSVFESLEHYARKLKLSADENEAGQTKNSGMDDGKTPEKASPRTEHWGRPSNSRARHCPGMHSTFFKPAAAVKARASEHSHARLHSLLSRYVDPANIKSTTRTSQSPPVNVNAGTNDNAAGTRSPTVTTNEDLLSEAQLSHKIASQAAKVASAAAASSWNTFMECANMFVPVLNPPTAGSASTTTNTTTEGGTEGKRNDAKNQTSSSNGCIVGQLLKDIPGLKEIFPTEQEIQRVEKQITTLFDNYHVNMSLGEIHKLLESAQVSPNRDTQNETPPEQKDGQAEAVIDSNGEAQEATVAAKEQEKPSCQSNKQDLLQTDSVITVATAAAPSEGEKLADEEKGQNIENDECSADTSSASMLTDDDEDVMEAAEILENDAPRQRQPVPWILVDLPDDQEADAPNNLTATASRASSTVASDCDAEKKEANKLPEAVAEEGAADSTVENFIELVKHVTDKPDPELLNLLMAQIKQSVQTKTEKEKETAKEEEQLEKQKSSEPTPVLKENELTPEQQKVGGDTAAPSTKPLPPATTDASTMAPAVPSTSGTQGASGGASSTRTYSRRPHVNYAIQTMMTMGFSNTDGHLTQLLEALDGDIPRALDLLMQKIS